MKFLEEKLEKQYGTKITKEIIEGYREFDSFEIKKSLKAL